MKKILLSVLVYSLGLLLLVIAHSGSVADGIDVQDSGETPLLSAVGQTPVNDTQSSDQENFNENSVSQALKIRFRPDIGRLPGTVYQSEPFPVALERALDVRLNGEHSSINLLQEEHDRTFDQMVTETENQDDPSIRR